MLLPRDRAMCVWERPAEPGVFTTQGKNLPYGVRLGVLQGGSSAGAVVPLLRERSTAPVDKPPVTTHSPGT